MELFCKIGRRYHPAASTVVLETAREIALAGVRDLGPVLSSPMKSREFLIARNVGREHEVFGVLYLDSRHRVKSYEELFRGTIDGASVHPREVVKAALANNAAAVILSHNHPSGVPDPSQADEIITSRLRDALALVEIRLLDHIIVAGDRCTSLAERGLI